MNFGERLRKLRKEKGWSQEKLAQISGVLVNSIQGYERGRYLPNATSLEWLVKALDTTASDLLGF